MIEVVNLTPTERKQLQMKIIGTFKGEMRALNQELQQILADDLITAFQNRLKTFIKIQQKHAMKH
jgi:hypothetical protein